ncbi:MAG: hypothetical protein AAFU85_32745 [Planctomycetota bacterium]
MTKTDAIRWAAGLSVGTLLVAATSPLFVRSYLPREIDPIREVAVLKPHATYRWRSEGYATTKLGPHGMFGVDSVRNDAQTTVALWGDSQAEGACVSDREKIASQVSRFSNGTIQVLSMARSGDDCNDWIAQVPRVESRLGVDAHVFLVTEFSDWSVPSEEPIETVDPRSNWVAQSLPDFLVQAARNVATTGTESKTRELRFTPGPVRRGDTNTVDTEGSPEDSASMLAMNVARLEAVSKRPCVFLLAVQHPGTAPVASAQSAFETVLLSQSSRFQPIDVASRLSPARAGFATRGFHNGHIGEGHFNAAGNRIIADSIVESLRDVTRVD